MLLPPPHSVSAAAATPSRRLLRDSRGRHSTRNRLSRANESVLFEHIAERRKIRRRRFLTGSSSGNGSLERGDAISLQLVGGLKLRRQIARIDW